MGVRRFFRLNLAEWIAVIATVVGIVFWLGSLEARLNAQDRAHQESVEQFRQDIQYIRMRLDQALDGRALP